MGNHRLGVILVYWKERLNPEQIERSIKVLGHSAVCHWEHLSSQPLLCSVVLSERPSVCIQRTLSTPLFLKKADDDHIFDTIDTCLEISKEAGLTGHMEIRRHKSDSWFINLCPKRSRLLAFEHDTQRDWFSSSSSFNKGYLCSSL
jgi:hypothetical protein